MSARDPQDPRSATPHSPARRARDRGEPPPNIRSGARRCACAASRTFSNTVNCAKDRGLLIGAADAGEARGGAGRECVMSPYRRPGWRRRSAFRSPESRLISVDLPAPFGPITAWISPTCTSSETSATAVRPPKRFCRPSRAQRDVRHGRSPPRRPAYPVTSTAEEQGTKLPHAARQRQHDRDDDQAFDQLPMIGRRLQHFFEPDQDDRADQRTRHRPQAADQHHHQHRRGQVPAQHLRRDEAELRGGEIAGEARQRAGDHEGDQAQAVDRKTERRGRGAHCRGRPPAHDRTASARSRPAAGPPWRQTQPARRNRRSAACRDRADARLRSPPPA